MKLNPGAAAAGGVLALITLMVAALVRRSRMETARTRRIELDGTHSRFVGAAVAAQSERQVLTELADALRTGLGAQDVIILASIEREGAFQPLDAPAGGSLSPPDSARGAFAWLKHNPGIIVTSELGSPRFGAMRLPLTALAKQYSAEVLAPLVHRGQLVALAAVQLGRSPTAVERELLDAILPPAAAATANVRLHFDAARTLSLGQEVGLARTVQSALIPPDERLERGGVEVVAHVKLAPERGSEFWTFYDFPDGRLLVVIGDALGKGIGASMVTAIAKGCADALRALAPDDVDLSRMAQALSRALWRPGRGPKAHMMTYAALLIEPRTRKVWYVNAGHAFPYKLSPAPAPGTKPSLEALTVHGPPLGLEEKPVYPVGETMLEPGVTLIMLTDGIWSAADRPPQRAERAVQKTMLEHAAMSPVTLKTTMLATCAQMRGGAAQRDDEVLLLIRG